MNKREIIFLIVALFMIVCLLTGLLITGAGMVMLEGKGASIESDFLIITGSILLIISLSPFCIFVLFLMIEHRTKRHKW